MKISDSKVPDKKRRLLEAAYAVFSTKGYKNTKIEEVATEAGVAKGTVYRYFKNKESLFFELCQVFIDQMESEFVPLCNTSLFEFYTTMMAAMEKDKDFFLMFMEFWSYGSHAVMQEKFNGLYDNIRQSLVSLIQREQREGLIRKDVESDALASSVIALADGLVVQRYFCPGIDVLDVGMSFWKNIESGIREKK